MSVTLEPDPRPGPRFLLHDGSGRSAQRREPAQHLRRRQDGADAADGSRRPTPERMQLLVQLGARAGRRQPPRRHGQAGPANPGGQLGATRNGLRRTPPRRRPRRPRDAQRHRPRRLGAAPSREGIEDAAERALSASVRTWDDASKALQGCRRASAATNRNASPTASPQRRARRADRLIVNSLSGPLEEAVRIADAARGGLVASRHAAGNDEVGQLIASMNMTATTCARWPHRAEGVGRRPRRQREPALQERRVRRRVPRHGRLPENMAKVRTASAGNLTMTVDPKSGRDRLATRSRTC